MAKGRVNRRAGVTGSESLPEVPRPFADNTKLSSLGSRTTRLARADLEFGRRRQKVVLVRGLPARGYSRPHQATPPLAKRLSVALGFLRRQPRVGSVRERLKADPRIGFCVQRKERRQVLFALKRAGYGGSVKAKTFRRSYKSQWRC